MMAFFFCQDSFGIVRTYPSEVLFLVFLGRARCVYHREPVTVLSFLNLSPRATGRWLSMTVVRFVIWASGRVLVDAATSEGKDRWTVSISSMINGVSSISFAAFFNLIYLFIHGFSAPVASALDSSYHLVPSAPEGNETTLLVSSRLAKLQDRHVERLAHHGCWMEDSPAP